jgi:dihydrofolate synthase / folylpolyglutamate synthase
VTPLTYDALVAELFPRLSGGIRWGLERTRRMLASVGDPQLAFRVVHVGGTNGKGSVAAHAESVLRRSGRRTGLYTSPHLCSFRERIRIDGRPIGEVDLLRSAQRLWPVIEAEGPSFFEATTAVALLALAEAGVEDAVIEVGLGGRLDSTNVVEPAVVIITNVSLDHVQLLGPTLAHVAREKAGIIKTAAPVITAEYGSEAASIFRSAAEAAGAPLQELRPSDVADVVLGPDGTRFTLHGTDWGPLQLRTPLAGAHQAINAALAVRGLAALDAAPALTDVVPGIAMTAWPGRLQIEDVAGARWVFDVAHNVAGVEALVSALSALGLTERLTAVVGVLGDKDWQGMLGPLCAAADRIILCEPPTAPADRRWDAGAVLREVNCPDAVVEPDLVRALERARDRAVQVGGAVLVTGSFHTVGDALTCLGLCESGSDVQLQPPAFMTGGAPAARDD